MLLSSAIHIFYEPLHKVRKDSVFWAEMCMWSPPYHPNAVCMLQPLKEGASQMSGTERMEGDAAGSMCIMDFPRLRNGFRLSR
jgi:hypothetical protein